MAISSNSVHSPTALEMRISDIIAGLCLRGITFDTDKAMALQKQWAAEAADMEGFFRQCFPTRLVPAPLPRYGVGVKDGAVYTNFIYHPFNPLSNADCADEFIRLGWKPQSWTESGAIELTDDVVSAIPLAEAVKLAAYRKIKKKLTMLDGYLKVVEDGRIYHSINPMGTRTGRMTHASPNLGQVPKEDDLRSLFVATPGMVLVGVDADAIEARCLAAKLVKYDKGALINILEHGNKAAGTDFHSLNQRAMGFHGRDFSKTFLYACVTMDTQALTREGWKDYHQLTVGDIVLTYNAERKVKEWKPVLEKFYYEDAEVIELAHSQAFNFKSTPNHRWYTKVRRQGRNERYYRDEVVTTEEITSEHMIVRNAPMSDDSESTHTIDLLTMLKYGTDWCKVVGQLSAVERRAFLLGFLLADGYQNHHNNGMNWLWSQLAGSISEALIMASFIEHDKAITLSDFITGRTNPMVAVRLARKGFVTGQRLRKIKLPNQPVWCIRTENHSWVARQGNTITVTGNCVYGGGYAKLGMTVAEDAIAAGKKFTLSFEQAGKQAKTRLMKSITGYKALVDDLIARWKVDGYTTLCDGRRVYPKGNHVVLNCLLQGDGAIAMKLALVLFDDWLKEHNMVAYHIINCHDEWIYECAPDIAPQLLVQMKLAIEEAGRLLGMQCQLRANGSIGRTWKDVK